MVLTIHCFPQATYMRSLQCNTVITYYFYFLRMFTETKTFSCRPLRVDFMEEKERVKFSWQGQGGRGAVSSRSHSSCGVSQFGTFLWGGVGRKEKSPILNLQPLGVGIGLCVSNSHCGNDCENDCNIETIYRPFFASSFINSVHKYFNKN